MPPRPRRAARQCDRYAALGRDVERIERRPRRLDAHLGRNLDVALLQETIEIERTCCPFFAIDYVASQRRFSIAVEDLAQDPALDALEHALG